MKKFFKINEKDNVIVALTDLMEGEVVKDDDRSITLIQAVKRGHKIAIDKINENQNILKYGFPIGHGIKEIAQGETVHTNNTKTNLNGVTDYKFNQHLNENPYKNENLTFKGYIREDGNVGIRNELWIVPTVGCVNGTAERIIQGFKESIGELCKDIDTIQVFKHNYGCSQLGEDHGNTKVILGDIVKHPNAGGVLVLGLGCENNIVEDFKISLGEFNTKRVKFLVAQEVADEVKIGISLLLELYENMSCDKRETVSLGKLKVGLKCGGSDGLSGITANPLLGKFSDFLVAQGGSTILTEVPEMFGAETLLMDRAKDEVVFNKIVHLINDFKEYFIKYDQPIYENPSPGNKAGGITTLEDKSLGCTQKAGTETVVDVLSYGECLKTRGLNLLSAPGNDLVASTALGAAGCQLVLFTTGRGTPFGSFVPTMKIATNTAIFKLKPHWIDFNAGAMIEEETMEAISEKFIEYVISVASGTLVNNEKNNFREIAIFKSGVTL
jgi:altronate hydrolase